MVAWKRFAVPEFDYALFKGMTYQAPTPISAGEGSELIGKLAQGDTSVCGAHAVDLGADTFDRHAFKEGPRLAFLCLTPETEVRILGRSHGWAIQRALGMDGLDGDVAFDWITTRPMNTRLGPDDGIATSGGAVTVLTGNKYSDFWIGNRMMADNDWQPEDGSQGFRLLAASKPDVDDFHDCYITFTWSA